MPVPIARSAAGLDLTPRFISSSTVVGSPSAATETLVAQITGVIGDNAVLLGIWLSASVSFTVGTSGAAIRVRIRQGTTAGAGTVVADTGAITGGVAGTNLLSQDVQNLDAAPGASSYHVSLQVTSGAAASAVSQANIIALVV